MLINLYEIILRYYIGQWLNGLMNGEGTYFYKNGNIKYKGKFINDKYCK